MRLKQSTTKDGFTIGGVPNPNPNYILRIVPYYLVYDNTVVCRAVDMRTLNFFLKMYREDKSMLHAQVNRMRELERSTLMLEHDVYIYKDLLDMPLYQAMLIIEDATSHGFSFHFHNGDLYAEQNGFF